MHTLESLLCRRDPPRRACTALPLLGVARRSPALRRRSSPTRSVRRRRLRPRSPAPRAAAAAARRLRPAAAASGTARPRPARPRRQLLGAPGGQPGQPGPGQFGQQPPPGQPGVHRQASFGIGGANAGAAPRTEAPAADSPAEEEHERWLLAHGADQPLRLHRPPAHRVRRLGRGGHVPRQLPHGLVLDRQLPLPTRRHASRPTVTPAPAARAARADSASHVGAHLRAQRHAALVPRGVRDAPHLRDLERSGQADSSSRCSATPPSASRASSRPSSGRIFTFGGEAQLLLLNGTGGVGVAGGGTSALFRALAQRRLPQAASGGGFPLRLQPQPRLQARQLGQARRRRRGARGGRGLHEHERRSRHRRPPPITRIERFGLGHQQGRHDAARPSARELPFHACSPTSSGRSTSRSTARATTATPSRVSKGDECLGLDDFGAADLKTAGGPGFKAIPSRFTLGVKTNPFTKSAFHGLSGARRLRHRHLRRDVFIEEMAPQAPWTLYLGLGLRLRHQGERGAPRAAAAPPRRRRRSSPLPQTLRARPGPRAGQATTCSSPTPSSASRAACRRPLATGPDGHFVTRNLEPGTYKLDIKAPGFKPGHLPRPIGHRDPRRRSPGARSPGRVSPAWAARSAGRSGPQPGAPGALGAEPVRRWRVGPQPVRRWRVRPRSPALLGRSRRPGQPGRPGRPARRLRRRAPPARPTSTSTARSSRCPRPGNILGIVRDAESGAAGLRRGDPAHRRQRQGDDRHRRRQRQLRLQGSPPGAVMIKGEASGYMSHAQPRPRSAPARTRARRCSSPSGPRWRASRSRARRSRSRGRSTSRPTPPRSSATPTPSSRRSPTSSSATPASRRSRSRATPTTPAPASTTCSSATRAPTSVKAWLVGAGVDGSRLVAKGYGQDRPLAPNVTAAQPREEPPRAVHHPRRQVASRTGRRNPGAPSPRERRGGFFMSCANDPS